ncbi:hypothetical protein [Klebsiella pneumoniae]|uniref:hypothetical protein n=1 Tax=Klebsiella pneumoniae TaxID=573 RepID=UPI0010334C50|nr:hypothetical protein [Klebsiella pneumoniae]
MQISLIFGYTVAVGSYCSHSSLPAGIERFKVLAEKQVVLLSVLWQEWDCLQPTSEEQPVRQAA